MKCWIVVTATVAYFLLIAGVFGWLWLTHKSPKLTLATWSGPYSHAQTAALTRFPLLIAAVRTLASRNMTAAWRTSRGRLGHKNTTGM